MEDFLRKAKQIEYLIDSLPAAPEHTSFTPPPISTKGDNHGGLAVHTPEKTFQDERDSVDTDPDLIELEKEMRAVNGEYQSVLEQAGASGMRPFCYFISAVWKSLRAECEQRKCRTSSKRLFTIC